MVPDVVGGRVVQRPFAGGAPAQVVAQRGAMALRVERRAVEPDHLFLGPADEMPAPRLLRKIGEGFASREDVRQQQPPQIVIGVVLAHMRRRGKQQQMPRRPGKRPAVVVRVGARQGFRQPVAVGLPHPEVRPPVGGQLVGLVEDDEVVGRGRRFPQPAEHARAGQGVEAGDRQVALQPGEGVSGACVVAGGDAEPEPEQVPHLPAPVADEAGGRDDEHPPREAPRQHLAHVEPGHDRLARAGVVGQQEPERRSFEHAFVDGNPLVRERVDERGLRCEGRVGHMAVGKAPRFGDGGDGFRVGGEVRRRGGRQAPARGDSLFRALCGRALKVEDFPPRQVVGARLAVLPAIDGREGNPEQRREPRLRQPSRAADTLDPAREIVRNVGLHDRRAHVAPRIVSQAIQHT